MKMELNKRLSQVQPSLIRELKGKADELDNIIDFTLGEPHCYHQTYEAIQEQLQNLMKHNSLGYPNFYGIQELKTAVTDHCAKLYQQVYDANEEVLITTGCSEGLRAVLETILNENDEVIIFEPAFSLYSSMIKLCGAKVVSYDLHQTNFKVMKSQLLKCVTAKTKAILFNSPHNPSGHVFTLEDTKVIKDVLVSHELFGIVDEIYRDLVYDDQTFISMSDLNEVRDRLFIINGVSKSYAMTGWRIGYVLGPKEYIKYIGLVHQNLVSCASIVSQYAALAVLPKYELTNKLREYYDQNRQLIYQELKDDFEDVIYPKGGFYLYVKINEYQSSSFDYAMQLLEEGGVAVVPALAFQSYDSGYVRLSYCCERTALEEGIKRIKKYNKTTKLIQTRH